MGEKKQSIEEIIQQSRSAKIEIGLMHLQRDPRIVGDGVSLLKFRCPDFVAMSLSQWVGIKPAQGDKGSSAAFKTQVFELLSLSGVPVVYALREYPLDPRRGVMRSGYRIEGQDEVLTGIKEMAQMELFYLTHVIRMARQEFKSWRDAKSEEG